MNLAAACYFGVKKHSLLMATPFLLWLCEMYMELAIIGRRRKRLCSGVDNAKCTVYLVIVVSLWPARLRAWHRAGGNPVQSSTSYQPHPTTSDQAIATLSHAIMSFLGKKFPAPVGMLMPHSIGNVKRSLDTQS